MTIIVDDQALLANTHGLGEGGSGLPLSRGTWGRLLHHLVNLLKRQALGLGDEEVGIDECRSAKAAPDKEDGRLKIAPIRVNHIRGDDGNDLWTSEVRTTISGTTIVEKVKRNIQYSRAS